MLRFRFWIASFVLCDIIIILAIFCWCYSCVLMSAFYINGPLLYTSFSPNSVGVLLLYIYFWALCSNRVRTFFFLFISLSLLPLVVAVARVYATRDKIFFFHFAGWDRTSHVIRAPNNCLEMQIIIHFDEKKRKTSCDVLL